MQHNNITTLLNLVDVTVTNVEIINSIYYISIVSSSRPCCCPVCASNRIEAHDSRVQQIRDLPAFKHPTVLLFRKHRYRCKQCKKRFSQPLTLVSPKCQITNRCKLSILQSLSKSITLTQIAKDHFVSPSTVLRVLKPLQVKPAPLPSVLCIDEFKGNADNIKYQTVLGDGSSRKLVDVLSSRFYQDLFRYFSALSLRERQNVQYYVSDMNKEFKRVKQTCFPNAIHIIDKYHFIRQVRWALENVRKKVQSTLKPSVRKYFKRSKSLLHKPISQLTEEQILALNTMLNLSEDLRKAYQTAYMFYSAVLCAKNSQDAKLRLKDWIALAKDSGQAEWNDCIKAYENWFEEICNAFSHHYTNGFIEGINNKIKVLKRLSYRISSFRTLRNRILLLA